MFAGRDCPSGAQRTSSFLTTREVIIREERIRYAFWCRLGRGPRLNYHQYRGMRRIINLKRLFGIPLTCLYATVSRRSHNIINSSSLSFNNKIDMSSHSRLPFPFLSLIYAYLHILTIILTNLYIINTISIPFHPFLALHLLLLLLGERNQLFLLPDAPLASEVEGKDHDHDKRQEDGRPDGCKISESVSYDPEHEADHDAEYAADSHQHNHCIEEAFGPSERDVVIRNSNKFRPKRAHFSPVLIFLNFEGKVFMGFIVLELHSV